MVRLYIELYKWKTHGENAAESAEASALIAFASYLSGY